MLVELDFLLDDLGTTDGALVAFWTGGNVDETGGDQVTQRTMCE
jgi:hypothetical protein